MNLFLVTDEFNKSAMETSFRATVIAKDENSARWLVSQRSSTFQIKEVAAAAAFCIAEIAHGEEGVLTIVHSSGAQLLSRSQFKQPDVSEDIFYEIDILEAAKHEIPNLPNTEVVWFAVKNQPKYLMRRTVLRTDTPNPTVPGKYSQLYVAQQFFLNDQPAKWPWRYTPAGREYKTQFYDLTHASILEIRASILRNANTLPDGMVAEELLKKLWTFVRTEKGEGAVEIKDLQFYPGQQLYWHQTEACEWAMTLPQIIAGELCLNGEFASDIPNTNCQTF